MAQLTVPPPPAAPQKNLTAIKEKLDAGLEKQLEVEQVQAAAKLPEVAGNITFLEQTLARLQTHHDEHSKLDRQRKQAAKQERLQQDLERVRRILLLQVSRGGGGSSRSVSGRGRGLATGSTRGVCTTSK